MARMKCGQVFLGNNSALLNVQLSLVTKIVQALKGFDNVIYEIINEPYSRAGAVSDSWQAKVAATIKASQTGHLAPAPRNILYLRVFIHCG